eukprot:1159934-Pelagomonas_calceolata.AAC.4
MMQRPNFARTNSQQVAMALWQPISKMARESMEFQDGKSSCNASTLPRLRQTKHTDTEHLHDEGRAVMQVLQIGRSDTYPRSFFPLPLADRHPPFTHHDAPRMMHSVLGREEEMRIARMGARVKD